MGPWSSAHRSPFLLLLLLLLLSLWGGPTEASSTVDCVVAVEGAADEATRCPCTGASCPDCAHAGIQSLADAPIVLPDGCTTLCVLHSCGCGCGCGCGRGELRWGALALGRAILRAFASGVDAHAPSARRAQGPFEQRAHDASGGRIRRADGLEKLVRWGVGG